MYFNFKNFVLFILLATVISVSCKKQNTYIDYNPAIFASKEFVSNQQMMVQILNTYFKSLTDSTLWADDHALIDGADVYIQYTPELLMEIKYPSWGNNDGYGHFRIGTINAVPETGFYEAGALVNFYFDGFLYDKDTLEVDKMTVQNMESTEPSMYNFEVMIDSAIIIYSDTSGQQSFNMAQQFTLKKSAASTYTSPLDEILITGAVEGITMNLTTYSALVADSSEIVDKYTCPWLKNGVANLQVAGFDYPALIYYPEADSCKNEYLIEIDGNPFPFPFD